MSTFEKKHTEDNTKGFKEAYQVILDYCKKNKNRPMSDLIPGLEGSLGLLNLMEKHKNGTCSNEDKKEVKR